MKIFKLDFVNISKAFTMSEVLITLVVVGVVAAMTLPSLISKINLSQYIAQHKVSYSILSQAHSALITEYGTFQASIIDCTGAQRHNCFRDTFAKKFKVLKSVMNLILKMMSKAVVLLTLIKLSF